MSSIWYAWQAFGKDGRGYPGFSKGWYHNRVNEFLGILCEHLVNRGGIIHVRKTVAMGAEGITDFLQLNLNAFTLVEDDED
jgi:hypothetical protein